MAKAPNKPSKVPATRVRRARAGQVELPTFSENLSLIRKSGKPTAEKLKAKESTRYLLKEVVSSRPRISRDAVFYSRVGKIVDAFSVSPDDPTKIVRERADGSRVIGKSVHGRFRVLPAK